MMIEVFNRIIDVIIIIGAISPLIRAYIKWLSPKIKNERVKLLESYALRVVTSVEQISKQLETTGEHKRDMAFGRLTEYINNSGLNYSMTTEDIYDLIESAVNKMNNGV